MESNQGVNTNTILLVIVIIVLVAGAAIWWYKTRTPAPTSTQNGIELNVGVDRTEEKGN